MTTCPECVPCHNDPALTAHCLSEPTAPGNCPHCGERCEVCDERMCSTWGPEPSDDDPAVCRGCAEVAAA